jgi:hypothetical protein
LDNDVNVVFVASELSAAKEKREREFSSSKESEKIIQRKLNATGKKEDDAIIH